jgi:glyoxylase-like metal-dependent hydrolase (beta-lactamase superfamily II)
VVLYPPDLKLLISADALWENGFGVVFAEIEGAEGFEDVRNARSPRDIGCRCVLPGHGGAFCDFSAAIGRARRRLEGCAADPDRHAKHAAKVLVKFHLLEHRAVELAELLSWVGQTRYMRLIHEQYFASEARENWSRSLLDEP